MPRSKDPIDIRLIGKISSMYYEQGLNQQEISDRLHLSRPKVSRLLKEARTQGIVQINIVMPNENYVEIEHALEKRFGLHEVIIVESESEMPGELIKRQIGSAAANYLHRTAKSGDIIGVTWGTTLQAMVDTLQPKPMEHLHIVQSLGGVGPPEAKAHASDISRRLSQLLNAKLTLLPAPGIVGSVQAREVLLNDPQVKHALNLLEKIDTLYVGIGALETNPVLNRKSEELSKVTKRKIFESKAVGDIALHFFDSNGNEAETPLKDLVIGVTPGQMTKIETVVGLAGGPQKADVIHAALKGGKINVLISDSCTAEKVLEMK